MLLLYKNSLTYGFCEQTTNVTVYLPPRAGVYNSKQDYCYLTVKIIVLGLLRTKLGLWLFIRVKCRSGGGGADVRAGDFRNTVFGRTAF